METTRPPVETTREHYNEYPRRNNGARAVIVIAIIVVLAVIAAFAFGLIHVSQTQEGKAPVVSVSGGQAPAFAVDTAKVDVGSKTTDVTVPRVDVGTTQESVKVPTVHVQKAQ